jgi:hypothetical protein
MKLSIRLATVAVTAVAFAGVLGAQGRSRGGHASGGSPSRSSARSAAPRAQSQGFARQNVQRYAPSRPQMRGGSAFAARNDFRGRPNVDARSNFRGNVGARGDFRGNVDARGHVDVRGREGFGPVRVADHGRPLITRNGFVGARGFGRPAFRDGHFGAGFNRWGGRLVLPIGWGGRVVFGGFFPAEYAGYCEAVPYDYDYLLPPMAPSYDPCLFGDRIVVFDRFSRSIVFVAAL